MRVREGHLSSSGEAIYTASLVHGVELLPTDYAELRHESEAEHSYLFLIVRLRFLVPQAYLPYQPRVLREEIEPTG